MPHTKSIKLLFIAAIIGFVVGIAFIFIQPLFGMSPLTQRHAAGYMNSGSMSASTAIIIAWCVHLFISVCYGLGTGIALLISRKAIPFVVQIVFLGWFTTVIAPPANGLIVKLVGNKSFPSFEQLPPFNFQLDAKLVLHLLFFAAIAIVLRVVASKRKW